MKIIIPILAILFLLLPSGPGISAVSLSSELSGRILLNVEGHGEAWYVNPADNKRYYLGRPADAFRVMRELSLGIKNEHLAKIESSDRDKNLSVPGASQVAGVKENASSTPDSLYNPSPASASLTPQNSNASAIPSTNYDLGLTRSLSGKILLQVDGNGEAWYVNPTDLKKYYLGRPADAFRIMRELSLGITREDLAKIHKPGGSESVNQYSAYEHKTIQAGGNNYLVDMITIDLTNPKLKIVTDTANDANCKSNCAAKPLGRFILDNGAFAGINGTYFCDSAGCGRNYSFYPVFNTRLSTLINEDQCKYQTTGPMLVFDTNNKFYYFKESREFKSVADFEKNYGVKIQAAMGNKPRLIQDYMNYLIDWELDKKQLEAKATRNAIGYLNNKLYLVIAYKTTVPDLANIMQSLGVEYALNLDGGYSTALWYNDEYMVGPGRNVPNAILFKEE